MGSQQSSIDRATSSSIYTDGTYFENNADWHIEDSPWKAGNIARILSRNDVYPKTVAEVGCGAGEILRQLSLRMLDAEFSGYELSPQAFELCTQREADRLKFLLADIVDQDVKFDVLLCIDVFEHVDNYIEFLRSIRVKAEYKVFHIPLDVSISSILRGGMMAARRLVGHIHYFTPETAIATLEDCGYEVIDSFYTTPFAGLPSKSLKTNIAKIPRKLLFALSPDLMVKLFGGCSLMVLAK
jgi:hypothetical protein